MINNFSVKRCVKLTSTRDLEVYLRREKQTNPNVPKIKVGSRNQQMLTIFIQNLTPPYHFETWKKLPSKLLLDHLQSSIIALIDLKKRFGCFKVVQTTFRMNQQNQVKIWINQDPVLNFREAPLPHQPHSQFLMVGGVIKLFKPLLNELDDISRPDTLKQLLIQVVKVRSPGSKINIPQIDQIPISPKLNLKNFFQTKINKPATQRFIPHNATADQVKKTSNNTSNNSSIQNNTSDYKKTSTSPFSPLSPVSPISNWRSPRNSIHPTFNQKLSLIVPEENYKRKISFIYSNGDKSSDLSSPKKQTNTIKTQDIQINTKQHISKQLLDLSFGSKKSYDMADPEEFQYQKQIESREDEQKLTRTRFPYSTKSTIVTLKDTKNFGDIPMFIQEQHFEIIPQSSKIKTSMNQRNEVAGDLEQQFSNLFGGEQGSNRSSQKQLEFQMREQQFEQILFS